jgi:hypothetical protein
MHSSLRGVTAIRQGLHTLGYVGGQNITIAYRLIVKQFCIPFHDELYLDAG